MGDFFNRPGEVGERDCVLTGRVAGPGSHSVRWNGFRLDWAPCDHAPNLNSIWHRQRSITALEDSFKPKNSTGACSVPIRGTRKHSIRSGYWRYRRDATNSQRSCSAVRLKWNPTILHATSISVKRTAGSGGAAKQ